MSEDVFRPPLIELAFEPRDPADRTGLLDAIRVIEKETDGVRLIEDECGAFILEFTDMLVVPRIRERLHTCGFAVVLGVDLIAYREGLRRVAQTIGSCKSTTGGDNPFAEVTIRFEPLSEPTGVVFETRERYGNVPERFLPAVERSILSTLASGLLAGFPVVGVRAILLDGKFHDTASSEVAFEKAARAAVRALTNEADIDLLVPVVSVTVRCPPDYSGPVRDLLEESSIDRVNIDEDGPVTKFSTMAEISLVLGLPAKIDEISAGMAACAMVFDHYRVMGHDGGGDDTFPTAPAMRASVA